MDIRKLTMIGIIRSNMGGTFDFINEISTKHKDGSKEYTAKIIQVDENGVLMYYPKNGGKQMRFYEQLESLDKDVLRLIINEMDSGLDIFELRGSYEDKEVGDNTCGYRVDDITAIGITDKDGVGGVEFWENTDESVVGVQYDYVFPTRDKFDAYALYLLEKEIKLIKE